MVNRGSDFCPNINQLTNVSKIEIKISLTSENDAQPTRHAGTTSAANIFHFLLAKLEAPRKSCEVGTD